MKKELFKKMNTKKLPVSEQFKSFDDYSKDENYLVSTSFDSECVCLVFPNAEKIDEHVKNINIILKEYRKKHTEYEVVFGAPYKDDGRYSIFTNLPWKVYVKNMKTQETQEHKMREYRYIIKDWNKPPKRFDRNLIEHLQVENLKKPSFAIAVFIFRQNLSERKIGVEKNIIW